MELAWKAVARLRASPSGLAARCCLLPQASLRPRCSCARGSARCSAPTSCSPAPTRSRPIFSRSAPAGRWHTCSSRAATCASTRCTGYFGPRARALLDLFALVVLGIFVGSAPRAGWDVAFTSYIEHIRSNTPLRIPLAWAQLPWFGGIALFALALALAICARSSRSCAATTQPPPQLPVQSPRTRKWKVSSKDWDCQRQGRARERRACLRPPCCC